MTAQGHLQRNEEVSTLCRSEENEALEVDENALKELAFQMAARGKRLGVQLDLLHETFSKETLDCEDRETLSAELRKKTYDVGIEVRALAKRVEELQQVLRKGKESCTEQKDVDLSKPRDQLSLEELKAKLETLETEKKQMVEEKKDWEREVQFLKCQLQYREDVKTLQERNDSVKLEQENVLLRKENRDLKQKFDSLADIIRKQGFTAEDEDLSTLLDSPSEASELRISGLESELEILRKERKIILATVLKQRIEEKGSSRRNGTVLQDVGVQSLMMGQKEDEIGKLRNRVQRLEAENEDMEEENKALDDENIKLMEEKRTLEDQVIKLKRQISNTLDSSLDEIEFLNQSNEELQERLDVLEEQSQRFRQAFAEFKEKNTNHFESVLSEIERKDSLEEAVDCLATAIEDLSEFNNEAIAFTANEVNIPRVPTERIRHSSLSDEIKLCKDLIESQCGQIRQIQFEKRDLEESLTKMKRDVMILRSAKKSQEKSQEFLVAESSKRKGTGLQVDCNDVAQQNEAIQQEIGYLKSRRSELENLARSLKEDNCKLEDEKFCLLGSFYHLLERNEALERQVDKLKESIGRSNDATKTFREEKDESSNGSLTTREQSETQSGNDSLESSEDEADFMGESTEDLKCKIQRIGDRLQDVQDFVLEAEGEKTKLKDELGESKKSEKEFRSVVMQLKKELTVLKERVEKAHEMNTTLQDCLREAHDEKQELLDSLDEINEEKAALEKSKEDLEEQMKILQRERDNDKDMQKENVEYSEKIEKARQHLKTMCTKLTEVCKALAEEELSTELKESNKSEEDEIELEIEELCKESVSILDQVAQETERFRLEKKRIKFDSDKLKSRVDTLLIEKQALQKYVRELDEKKRQLKVFISKVTEEKESLAEIIDEIKQQKMNLADALENVYHSKEGIQSKLDEASLRVSQLKTSLLQGAEESKTLRASLCRVVEERDTVKKALLADKKELDRLRESEVKWKEIAMESQTEADQIVEADRASKEGLDELQKKVESLLMSEKAIKEVGDEALMCNASDRMNSSDAISKNGQGTNGVCVEEIQVATASVYESCQNGEEAESADAEHFMPLQNGVELASKGGVTTYESTNASDYEKWREEKEKLAEMLKQSAEENDQLRDWLDAMSVEKERLERELDNTSDENENLIRDLQRSTEDKEQFKLLLDKVSKAKERQLDHQSTGEPSVSRDENTRVKDLKDTPSEQLATAQQQRDSLAKKVQELTKDCANTETELESARRQLEELTGNISTIRRGKDELSATLQEVTEEKKVLNNKYEQLFEDNVQLKTSNEDFKRSVQQAEVLRTENAKLSESNKNLKEDLKNLRKTFEKSLQRTQEFRKEIRGLSESNQGLERELESAKEQVQELQERLHVAQQEIEGLNVSVSELTTAKSLAEVKCTKLTVELEDLSKATALENVQAEKDANTMREEFEKCKNELGQEIADLRHSLKTEQEKLTLVEEELQKLVESGHLLTEPKETGLSGVEERQSEEKVGLLGSLDQLRTLRQTLEHKAEERKELENCLHCVEQQVNELKESMKRIELDKTRGNTFLDEVQSDDNKTNCEHLRESIIDTLQGVQKCFEELITQRTLVEKKLEGEIAKSEEKAMQMANEIDRLQEDLSRARRSNEDASAVCDKMKREQEALIHTISKSKLAEETHRRREQELQDTRNVVMELQTEKANMAATLNEKEQELAAVTSEKSKRLEEMDKEIKTLATTKNDLQEALTEAQESANNSKKELEHTTKLVKSLQQEIEGINKQLRKSQNEKEDLKVCISKLDKEKSNRQKVLKELENKNLVLEKQIGETEKKRAEIQDICKEVLEGLQAKKENSQKEQQRLEPTVLDAKDNERDVVVFTVKELDITVSKLTEKVAGLENKNQELAAQYREKEMSLKEVREKKSHVEKKLKEQAESGKCALNKSQEEKKDLKACVASLDKEKRALQKQVKELKGIQDKFNDLEDKMLKVDKLLQVAREEKETSEKDLEKAYLEMESTKEQLHQKQELSERQENEIKSLRTTACTFEEKFKDLENSLKEKERQVKQCEEEQDILRNSQAVVAKDKELAESRVIELKKLTAAQTEQLQQLTKDLESLTENHADLQATLHEAKSKEATLGNEIENERKQKDKEVEERKKENSEAKTELEKAKQEQESLVKKLNEERKRKKSLEILLKTSKEEKDSSCKSIKEREEENRRLKTKKQELDARIKETEAKLIRVTDEKKRLEKQLDTEKNISSDLRLRLGEANKDKDELEDILEQQRHNKEELQDELAKNLSQKEDLENKLKSVLGKLNKTEGELQERINCSKEHDAKLKQSDEETKTLMRELEESKEEVSSVRMRLEELTSSGERKNESVEDSGTEMKVNDNQDQRVCELKEEVSIYAQKNEDLNKRLDEADAKMSKLETKLNEALQERVESEERLERSRQASNRLKVAFESIKEDENRLRKQLEESKDREQSLDIRLQEMVKEREKLSSASAVEQECVVERVLVTCAEGPEINKVHNLDSICEDDRIKAISLENAKKEVALLESQVRGLRAELRKAKDQVFDLQQELSDSERALRQKERLYQQERKGFQENMEEIERECEKLRKELSSLAEMETRRSSFSTVKELKGTLRKAESDMWDAISKTARLLERAKDEVKEAVIENQEDKSATQRVNPLTEASTGEKRDLFKEVEEITKEKERLGKKLKRAEGTKQMLKQILVDTIADVYNFKRLVDLGSDTESEIEPRRARKQSRKQELEVQSHLTASDLQEAEQLRSHLEELRRIIKDLEKSLVAEKSKGDGNTLDYMRTKCTLEAVNENLRQRLNQTEKEKDESLKREKKLEELLLRTQHENRTSVEVKHGIEDLRESDEIDGKGATRKEANELRDRLHESEARVRDLTSELNQIKRQKGELLVECERLKKELLDTSSVLENERKLQQDGFNLRQSRDEIENKNKMLECELHETKDAIQVLEKDKEFLATQCNILEGKMKEVAEGKNQLLEDALGFKVKYLKKNQDLTYRLEAKEHDVISLQVKYEGLASLKQKMEADLLNSEEEMANLRLRLQAVESEKEHIERTNKEQKFEVESLREIGSRHDELNVKLKHLLSKMNKLEDSNRALLEEKSRMAEEYATDKDELLLEQGEILSRLRELEEENKLEASLKEERAEQLREKENQLETDSASIKKEKEKLENIATKIQQMREEYMQLEDEYNILLESINETRQENIALKKENSLIRKACDQLRARQSLTEEKISAELTEFRVESALPLHDKPERTIVRENIIPVHKANPAAAREGFPTEADGFPYISDDKAFKRHSIAHSTRDHSGGLLIPISLSGPGQGRATQRNALIVDRRRANSLPRKQEMSNPQRGADVKWTAHNAPLATSCPVSSSDSSSRSSEADSSVCSKRHYCSPILSVVDLCPLHHDSPLERKPSHCPVCRKKKEKKRPKEFISLEKYV